MNQKCFFIIWNLVIKSTMILDSFKYNLKFCTYFLHSLQRQKSHSKFFFLNLNSSRDLVFLYLVCIFTKRNDKSLFLYIPFFCKNFLKISVVCVAVKLKKRIHYWWCYTTYNFVHFCQQEFQIANICDCLICHSKKKLVWNLVCKLLHVLPFQITTFEVY